MSSHIDVSPVVTATGLQTVEGAAETFHAGPDGVTVHSANATSPQYSDACHPDETDATATLTLELGWSVGVAVTADATIDIKIANHTLVDKDHNFGTVYDHLWRGGPYCIKPNL